MKRLILAGADAQPLEALASALWRMRKSLIVEVYDDHHDAAEALLDGSLDVIACDLSDGSDAGRSLLEIAKRSAPMSVRIALASPADADVIFRAVSLAHRTLFRPWFARDFSRMLTRLLELRESFMLDHCEIVFGADDQIPPVPAVYAQLIAQLSSGDVDIERVAATIERDLTLTSAILRVTNSALFGLDRDVNSVRDAILYMGLDTIRDIALSDEAIRLVDRVGHASESELKRLRRTSSIVARVCEALGARRNCRESAFLAGLMHILGFISEDTRDEEPDVAAELGGYLLGLWGLPEPVVHAVSRHVAPRGSDLAQPVAACLFLAVQLTGERQPDAPVASALMINRAMRTVGISDVDFADLRRVYPHIRRP